MESVSWSVSPATSRPLRYVTYLVFGLFVGLVILISLILFGLGIARYSQGDPRLLGLLAVLWTVGGLLTALYVGPTIRDADRTLAVLAIQVGHLDRRWLAFTSVAWAATLWYLAAVSLLAAFGAIVLAVVALFGLYGAATNEGQIDPVSGTLTYRGHDIDLETVRDATGYPLGPVSLLRLTLGNDTVDSRTLLLPTDVARLVREGASEDSSG